MGNNCVPPGTRTMQKVVRDINRGGGGQIPGWLLGTTTAISPPQSSLVTSRRGYQMAPDWLLLATAALPPLQCRTGLVVMGNSSTAPLSTIQEGELDAGKVVAIDNPPGVPVLTVSPDTRASQPKPSTIQIFLIVRDGAPQTSPAGSLVAIEFPTQSRAPNTAGPRATPVRSRTRNHVITGGSGGGRPISPV